MNFTTGPEEQRCFMIELIVAYPILTLFLIADFIALLAVWLNRNMNFIEKLWSTAGLIALYAILCLLSRMGPPK